MVQPELPRQWQEILDVRTENEMIQSVRDYQDALNLSKNLLKIYTA